MIDSPKSGSERTVSILNPPRACRDLDGSYITAQHITSCRPHRANTEERRYPRDPEPDPEQCKGIHVVMQ